MTATLQRFFRGGLGRYPLALLAMSLLFPVSTAEAAPITTSFTGTVYQVPAPLGGTFSIGDTIVGSVTYDATLTAADSNPSPEIGFYAGPGITDFTATIGGYNVGFGGSLFISVHDNITTQPHSDRIDFRASATGAAIGGSNPWYIQHGYQSNDPTRLSDDGVPTQTELTNFLPSEGSGGPNHMAFNGADGVLVIRWNVDSVETVPEPAAMLLMATSIAAAISRRRRA